MARRKRGQFPMPKKENGQWKIRYYIDQVRSDGSVRRVRKTKCLGRIDAMTSVQARKEAMRFLQDVNDVQPWVEHSDRTLAELVDHWRVTVKPNLKRSTQEGYEWAIGRLCRELGTTSVATVGVQDIQRLLTRAGRTLAGKSVRDLRAYLSGLFSTAEDWEWIPRGSNPVRGRLRLPENRPVRIKVVLTNTQFGDLVKALRAPYSTAVTVAVLTGLRRGELEALRWSDIGDTSIRVDEAVYRGTIGTPKTARSMRTVETGLVVNEALDQWRQQTRFRGPEDFVFAVRTNTPIDLHAVVARHLHPACAKINLPPVSWHDFRHTYATWSRRVGLRAEALRAQLGHASIQTTLDIYSHADEAEGFADLLEAYGTSSLDAPQAANGTLNGTPNQVEAARKGTQLVENKWYRRMDSNHRPLDPQLSEWIVMERDRMR